MGLGKRYELTEIARRHFDPPLAIAAGPDHGWLILLHGRPQAIVLDALLNELRQIELTVGRDQHVALSRDGRYLAVLGRSELRIADGQGQVRRRVRHPSWPSWAGSDCTFDARDRLWYVRPGDRPGINDRLTAVDPASGETLCEQFIENPQGYARICPSPDPDRVLVEIGCGQDGSYLYLGHLTGSALTVQPYDFGDPCFGGFSPDGTEMVTAPHEADELMIHSFPDGAVIASLGNETAFAEDDLPGEEGDGFGYQAIYLDAGRILASTRAGRMVLIDRAGLRLLGTVWPEGSRLRGFDGRGQETDAASAIAFETDHAFLQPAGPGTALTTHGGDLCLLDLAPLLAR